MKKLLILIFATLCTVWISAQNVSSEYDKYLQDAFSALSEGKVDMAQKWYSVYKKLTGKVDEDFEALINDATTNAWENSCHIINLGKGEYLAVQKITSDQQELSYGDAKSRCRSVRIGGFNDWRLPTESELNTIFSSITLPINGYFWTSYYDKQSFDKANRIIYFWLIIKNTGERVVLKEKYVWNKKKLEYEKSFYKNEYEYSSSSNGSVWLRNHYLAVRKFSR